MSPLARLVAWVHRRTHAHHVLTRGDLAAVICSPGRLARRVGGARRFMVRVGDADWVELTYDQFVNYAGQEDLP